MSDLLRRVILYQHDELHEHHLAFCSAICFIIPANPPPGLTRTSERCRAGEPVEGVLVVEEGFFEFEPPDEEPGGTDFVGFCFGRDWAAIGANDEAGSGGLVSDF